MNKTDERKIIGMIEEIVDYIMAEYNLDKDSAVKLINKLSSKVDL